MITAALILVGVLSFGCGCMFTRGIILECIADGRLVRGENNTVFDTLKRRIVE